MSDGHTELKRQSAELQAVEAAPQELSTESYERLYCGYRFADFDFGTTPAPGSSELDESQEWSTP